MGEYITTYTGKHFYPLDPDPADICISDIAHALSLICRGNGQVQCFYSVGEHCINCALEARERGYSPKVVLACLLHDAGECYLSDVPRPFKQYLKDYQKVEDQLLSCIYQKFLGADLDEEEQKKVKEIDDAVLAWDLVYLLHEGAISDLPPLKRPYSYGKWESAAVEQMYLKLYAQYTAGKDVTVEQMYLELHAQYAIGQDATKTLTPPAKITAPVFDAHRVQNAADIDPSVRIALGAMVSGTAVLEKDVSVWYNAVIRADAAQIHIGRGSNIQDLAVLHVDPGHSLTIGADVTVGHGVILHGCSIGENTLIGMGAIVMNGTRIGDNCIIGAGALVLENSEIPEGSVVLGNPAKVHRMIRLEEIAANRRNAEFYREKAAKL